MELSDKDAILLVVHALPTADIWHEISPEEVRTIFQQASRELARLESVELSSGLTKRPADGAYWLCKNCGQRNDIKNIECEACG